MTAVLTLVACALVFVACVCRVNLLKAGKHRFSWAVLYTMWAVFSLGVAIGTLSGREVDWWVCVGLAGVLAQLVLTRRDWKYGAPRDLERICPR